MASAGQQEMLGQQEIVEKLQQWAQASASFDRLKQVPDLLTQKASTAAECAESWRSVVERMLGAVSEAFPECKGSSQCLALFKNIVGRNEDMLRECIKSWYAEVAIFVASFLKAYDQDPALDRLMTVCAGVRKRGGSVDPVAVDIGSIMLTLLTSSESNKKKVLKDLTHPTTILNIIKLEEKWAELGDDVASKMSLTQYFIILTGYSIIYDLHEKQFLSECRDLMTKAIAAQSVNPNPGLVFVQILNDMGRLSWFNDGMAKFNRAVQCIQIETACSGILTPGVVEPGPQPRSCQPPFMPSSGSKPAASVDLSQIDLTSEATKAQMTALTSQLGLDKAGLVTDENLAKFQSALTSLPPEFVQKFVGAFQSGDMSILMDPTNFAVLAQACESNEISVGDMMAGIDLPSLLAKAQEMPLFKENPMAQQILSAVGGMGGTEGIAAALMSAQKPKRPSCANPEDTFVLPDYE